MRLVTIKKETHMIWFSCPKCGLKDSSWDGYRFCGDCEKEYQASLSDEFKEQIRKDPYDHHWCE